MTVLCPAKINLFLSVGPPDATGYHPIRSIFQTISLADTLTVTPANTPSLTSNWPDLPAENTLTRTLRLLDELATVPPLAIHLEKRIPAQSGLGGGSSDAAGLIRALVSLYPEHWPHHHILSVAATVGKDVPFFLTGGTARVTGYGEQIETLPDAPLAHLVIVQPSEGTSTADAYRALDAAPRPWRDFPPDDTLYNDFERVASCGSTEAIERLLVAGATDAGLTGSGSAVFGRFPSAETAAQAAAKLTAEGWPFVAPAHTLTQKESQWMS